MPHHAITSVRLPLALQEQLEQAAHDLRRGKSWIIVHALEAYLNKLQHNALMKEARRQSLLAAKEDNEEEMRFWEENSDTTGWE
jgi:predicted DNA-binding protein